MASESLREDRLAQLVGRFEEAAAAYRSFLASRDGDRDAARARLDAALAAVEAARRALDELSG